MSRPLPWVKQLIDEERIQAEKVGDRCLVVRSSLARRRNGSAAL